MEVSGQLAGQIHHIISILTGGGRLSTGWLHAKLTKPLLNFSFLRRGGRLSSGWLKVSPKVREVTEEGRLSTGCLNILPNIIVVIEGSVQIGIS
jgi:hypothetical protein